MKPALIAALVFATNAFAQHPADKVKTAAFKDPANLRGERISPRTGRELPIDQGARGLEQMLRKLNTRASMMLIVAHPDDEDGGLLTLYSRGRGARVAMLTLNRGEGGQNAVTADFEDALGLLRTQELLSADRYLGVDQMFGTEVDFGFSKTKEEAFRKWTHERVLYDAVRAVRLYRPLVLASVFIGGVTDGHGQHQVSGEIAQEVFKAAADPKVFPELTAEGILPWAPLKVYARVPMQAITPEGLFDYATGQYAPARFTNYVTGEITTTAPSADVTVHEGETDSLLSDPGESVRSYVQFARIGLGLQKTQIGPGVRLAAPGTYDISYHRYGSRLHATQKAVESSVFDGIDTTLGSIAGLSPAPPKELKVGLQSLTNAFAQLGTEFDRRHPEQLAPPLARAQDQLGRLIYALDEQQFEGKADVLHELRVKQVQLNEALLDALGLDLETKGQAEVLTGSSMPIDLRITSHVAEPVGIFSEIIEGAGETKAETLLSVDAEPSVNFAKPFSQRVQVPPQLTQQVTRPYFFRTDIEQPVYRLRESALRNAPATPPALVAWTTLRYHQVEVRLGRVVGENEQPTSIVPPASVLFPLQAQVLPQRQSSVVVNLKVDPPGTRIQADPPPGWDVTPDREDKKAAPGMEELRLDAPAKDREAFDLQAVAVLSNGGKVREGFRPVGYPGIPSTNFFQPASERIVPVDLKLPTRRRIAYVAGTGDAVPEALASIGLPVTMLPVTDLTTARLVTFDTVILGVRTYNAHPDLHGGPTEALLAFARNGGNVIVQYQTSDFTSADAPYPLNLGSAEKVIDETDPVTLLEPQSSLLSKPNRIVSTDFHGWIEERGHGFLQDWDGHYAAATETHDPGQLPQKGGLITTQIGRGHWTYCAFALYRQLPEAVPGAFRLFVNLLGLADTP
ncbi:MAG: PIG-L family deacetylase [Janthinobacterium lividum]